jgi:hypothetical protein
MRKKHWFNFVVRMRLHMAYPGTDNSFIRTISMMWIRSEEISSKKTDRFMSSLTDDVTCCRSEVIGSH